jgi:putative redox protein
MGLRIDATFTDPAGEALRLEARDRGGYRLTLDASSAHPDAMSPKEAVLAALAACTSMDVASILRKKRQRLDAYDLEVSAEEAADHPRVFTRVVVDHVVRGSVEAEALRRAIELSATRYCPVSAMLAKAAIVEHRYRLVGEDGRQHEVVVAVLGPGKSRG